MPPSGWHYIASCLLLSASRLVKTGRPSVLLQIFVRLHRAYCWHKMLDGVRGRGSQVVFRRAEVLGTEICYLAHVDMFLSAANTVHTYAVLRSSLSSLPIAYCFDAVVLLSVRVLVSKLHYLR